MKKLYKFIAFFLLGLLLFSIGFFYAVKWGAFGKLPTEEQLRKINNQYASEVYATRGELIGKYFSINRTEAQAEDIPEHLKQALIATEDIRFYDHSGIDSKSFARVVIKTVLLGQKNSGGGSTITQQLAKNIFGRSGGGTFALLIAKIKEQIIALRIENVYSKEAILLLYLNTVPFGENVYGIETASKRFFGKSPIQLKVEEAAVLVGLLKANTTYNPKRHPEAAEMRRNVVIKQMSKAGYLSPEASDSLKKIPLQINYQHPTQEDIAPYFLDFIQPEIIEILKKHEELTGTHYDLFTDGLRVETTMDFEMQLAAKTAMHQHLNQLQVKVNKAGKAAPPWKSHTAWFEGQKENLEKVYGTSSTVPKLMQVVANGKLMDTTLSPIDSLKLALLQLHSGLITTDVRTGAIKAWVGGLQHRVYPYNLVLAKRQVGSTYKPFVYLTALESGLAPCDFYNNEWVEYPQFENWAPQNYDKKYDGAYSMGGALSKSINTVTAAVAISIGLENVVAVANRLGIPNPKETVPALALGAQEISLFQMNQAYSTLANEGRFQKQFAIVRILDKTGAVIYENAPLKANQIVERETALTLQYLLKKVVDKGTAASSRKYGVKGQYAGKTGTTSNYADGWFIGFNNNYSTAVWVGHQYPILSLPSHLGSSTQTAVPIWATYIAKMERSKYHKAAFSQALTLPNEKRLTELDCPDYLETESFWDWILQREDDGTREEPKPAQKEDAPGKKLKNFWNKIFKK